MRRALAGLLGGALLVALPALAGAERFTLSDRCPPSFERLDGDDLPPGHPL
jgi:hypothetical protein